MDKAKLLGTLSELKERVTAPWRKGETPLELRKAVLEELVERTVPIAPGKRVVAFDRVRIELYPTDPEDGFVLGEAIPTWEGELREAVDHRLAEIGCDGHPVDITIELVEAGSPDPDEQQEDGEYRDRESRDWADSEVSPPTGDEDEQLSSASGPGGRYALFFDRSGLSADPAAATEPRIQASPSKAQRPSVDVRTAITLEIVRGKAEKESYRFSQPKIFIGRTADVLDTHGRIRRRNHIAFVDDDENSNTVSREHARLLYREECGEAGEYWLVDERSAHGTRLFRNGRTIDISSRDRRGVRVQVGDEIYLGKALLRCTDAGSASE